MVGSRSLVTEAGGEADGQVEAPTHPSLSSAAPSAGKLEVMQNSMGCSALVAAPRSLLPPLPHFATPGSVLHAALRSGRTSRIRSVSSDSSLVSGVGNHLLIYSLERC